jgi:outer membrane lipoprotein-sorting protein
MTLDRRTFLASSLATGALLAAPLQAQTAQERGLAIATEAANRRGGYSDISASGEMILQSGSGQDATRRFDASWITTGPGQTRSLLVFQWPGDIRNTALLTHAFEGRSDDQWLYLPAMARVRRISGSGRSGSFVGSEFAFEDMVDQQVDNFDHTWVADGPCPAGGSCHILDLVPTTNSGYSRQRVWFDQAELRIQQVQYFDRRGAHLKTLTISDYSAYQGRFWRAGRMDMVNHLTGASTRMNWADYAFDRGLQASGFTVNALRRIR